MGEALFAPVPALAHAIPPSFDPTPNPYLDYARRYTPQGGVALDYKDIDMRLRVKLLKFVLWCLLSAATIGAAFTISPYPIIPPMCRSFDCDPALLARPLAFNIIGILVLMIVYAVLLSRPRYLQRSVEVRADRFIIEGSEEFYRDRFDMGWPSFRPTENGLKLTGTYGTRFVDFFDVVRCDEHDRMPELFAAHLQSAFAQLWSQPS